MNTDTDDEPDDAPAESTANATVEATDDATAKPTDETTKPGSHGQHESVGDVVTVDGRSLTELVQLGLLAILLLVIGIATFQFYFAAGAAVDRFVTRQYRPLFQAGFNLAIVLAAGAGLSMLVRRLA